MTRRTAAVLLAFVSASRRLDDAKRKQLALAAELDRERRADGYVFEEPAEIAVARNDVATAATWAAKAYAELSQDAGFAASDPARFARLRKLSASPG